MSFVKEFREFAVKGNVVDMAVGLVIGAGFGKIVSSFVSDVIMPPLGLLIGGVDFTGLLIPLKDAVVANGVVTAPAVALKYGAFIQQIFDFAIVAFAMFLLIKGINRLKRQQAEAPVAPPAPSAQEKLLGEIRDILKAK